MSHSAKSEPEQLITENLDIWTAVIQNKAATGRGSNKKQELYGIKKLRELILDLAVKGHLCECSDEENWELVAIKDLMVKGLKTINPEDNSKELVELWSVPAFSLSQPEIVKRSELGSSKKELPDKSVLLSKINPHLNRVWKVSKVTNYVLAASPEWITLLPDEEWNRDFLVLALTCSRFKNAVCGTAQGMGSLTRANIKKVGELNVFRPPIEDQKRIHETVNRFMALCDQLEQQTESSLSAHQTLVETLLKALLDAAQSRNDGSSKESAFEQTWQRIADHFDVLFTTEHSIDQLKQTILQLAVMGKLVPQDPNDEPANVLLEKIAAEKERLVQEGKIKKQKKLPPISDEEKPFELPEGWEWCRLGEIVVLQGGFAYKSTLFTETGDNQVVRMGNIRPDFLRLNEKSVFVSDELAEATRDYQIKDQDILLTMTGTKGKRDYLYSVMVTAEDLRAVNLFLNQRLCIARPIFVSAAFLNTVFKDDRLLDLVFAKSTGTANQANIGMEAIQNWVIPVPPKNLQKYIVEKKDELVSLCGSLSEHILAAQKVQFHLADAMAEQALK